MATPQVAGVVALVSAVRPDLSTQEVFDTLTSTATDLGSAGRDNTYGYGLVNARAALDAVLGGCTSAPTSNFNVATNDRTVTLTSQSSGCSLVGFEWDLGDGNLASGESISHTYAANGTYTVTLTVTDEAGLSDTSSQSVTVEICEDEALADGGCQQC